MKRLSTGLALTLLAGAAGCDKAGTPGGPGAAAPSAKPPLIGRADDTFDLTTASVSLAQGEAAPAAVGIKRGTNFDQDVTLAFDGLPPGVTLDPAKPVVLTKNTDAKFTLTAGDTAAPGEFTVKVSGRPAKGADATTQFTLTVAKRDAFAISVPFWTTALKQGEAKAIAIAISREKRFDQDVTLTFDRLPKGVTVEPAAGAIKTGESEARLTIRAADDADLGEFAVKITGHAPRGPDAVHEFKFTVAKK